MATGFPVKANYATGDVLTAANMNDLSETVNLIAPAAKGDLFAGSAANTYTKLAVGTNGQVLTADSTAATGLKWAAAAAAGGKLKQAVSMTYATQKISSSSTYADTGLSLAITPTSASNSIYIIWNMFCGKLNDDVNAALGFKTFRDATAILDDSGYSFLYSGTALNSLGGITRIYKDSPATTSATTYKVQYANQANAGSVRVNYGGTTSSLWLLEIEA